jgi:hypothetical protein
VRISVECGGYAEAAGVCRTANQIAALSTESLAGKLGAYAAMAGDDATSRDFAGSYDPAAREAVATLADLTHALIGLGRLIDASGRAHERAEASAVGAAGVRTNAYTGGGLDEDSFVRVSPAPPPSSLGGSVSSGLGDISQWILDQVEGFVWPGADVDLLRDAAAAWRRTSGSVADLTAHLDVVAGLLERQVSPEIPLALAAISELRTLVEDTADQLLTLADACDDYATAVEDTRDRTRVLLTEIGQMVVEEVTLTAIVTGITGGFGGGVKAAAALARIRAQAPRFQALLVSLRAVAATTASRLRATQDELVRAREGFDRFLRLPARDERGEMVHPLGWGGAGGGRLARVAETIRDPRLFDPASLRGLKAKDIARLLEDWPTRPASRGDGIVYEDPLNRGRQIRIMEGYPGNRPDPVTHGPYVVVSQNGPPLKFPLEGNPTL